MGQKGTRAVNVASRCQNLLVNLQGKLKCIWNYERKMSNLCTCFQYQDFHASTVKSLGKNPNK